MSDGHCPQAYEALIESGVQLRLAERAWPQVRAAADQLAELPTDEFAALVGVVHQLPVLSPTVKE